MANFWRVREAVAVSDYWNSVTDGQTWPAGSANEIDPTFAGTIGFLVHQSVPLLAMWMLFGIPPVSFWAANLTYYNMPPMIGLLASWLVWTAGAWWGAQSRKRKMRHKA